MIGSYGSIYQLGHRATAELFLDPVLVEEKVDGSQISFGVRDGELHVRSKSVPIVIGAEPKQFKKAVDHLLSVKDRMIDGWTYRGEAVTSPKHNTLAYDRCPSGYVALFDVECGEQTYVSPQQKAAIASELDLEAVPVIYSGNVTGPDQIRAMLDRVSFLGGQKIEGVVVKNYLRFGPDKKVLLAKFVSEAFKEVHRKDYKARNPNRADVLETIIESLRTEARWNKAVQHLRDRGELQEAPQDIGPLMKELAADVEKECEEEIKERLYAWARKDVLRGVQKGLAEWYKARLMGEAFDTPAEGEAAE